MLSADDLCEAENFHFGGVSYVHLVRAVVACNNNCVAFDQNPKMGRKFAFRDYCLAGVEEMRFTDAVKVVPALRGYSPEQARFAESNAGKRTQI